MTQFQHVQSTYLPLPTPRVNKNVVNDTVCCYFSMLLVYLYTQACPADNYLSICEALVDIYLRRWSNHLLEHKWSQQTFFKRFFAKKIDEREDQMASSVKPQEVALLCLWKKISLSITK